jgi:hypothetical protein
MGIDHVDTFGIVVDNGCCFDNYCYNNSFPLCCYHGISFGLFLLDLAFSGLLPGSGSKMAPFLFNRYDFFDFYSLIIF